MSRYELLYKAHKQAITEGKSVSYVGIDKLFLEIPKNAESILNGSIDFSNVVFKVKNDAKSIFLFTLSECHKPIAVSKSEIDNGKFHELELRKGSYVLIIKDENHWSERIGYGYSAYRKDAILINRGRTQIVTCSLYNNQSNPICEYFNAGKNQIVVKNLRLIRAEDCSKKTNLINVSYKNKVVMDNLAIETPESNLYGDETIWRVNCVDVS